jgi:hypothetical protein
MSVPSVPVQAGTSAAASVSQVAGTPTGATVPKIVPLPGSAGGSVPQINFQYLPKSVNEAFEQILPTTASTYGTASMANVATHFYYLNGSPTASTLPLTLVANDTLRCLITRLNNAKGAYVQLTQ